MSDTTMVDVKTAMEALDSMDDFARMDTGVDAKGPRGVLEKLIQDYARLRGEAAQPHYQPLLKPEDAPGGLPETAQGEQQAVAWPARMVNHPCPDGSTDRIVGFRIEEGDPILGRYGLSEPLDWLRSVTVDRPQPVAGDAVRALPAEWRERAEELDMGDPIGVTHHWKLKDCADELEAALSASRGYDHG